VIRATAAHAFLAVTVANAQSSPASAKPGATVAGEWRGETFAAGSVATITLNFYPNGTYARRIVTATEFGWTLEGEDKLILAPLTQISENGPTYGKAVSMRIRIAGDSLIATAGRQSLVLKRVTALVPETPLLGRWEGLSDMNEPLTQDFTADGRLIITVTHSREAGRYSVGSDAISWNVQIPIPSSRRTRYRLEDAKLTIYMNPKLPPIELVPASDGATPP
jgi:hypothetical protein